MQSQEICDLLYGEKFFDETKATAISAQHLPEDEKISDLQNLVAHSLLREGVSQEFSLYEVGKKAVRKIDIIYQIGSKFYCIEVDGPSHFTDPAGLNANYSTRQRDAINEVVIAKIAAQDREREYCYLTFLTPIFRDLLLMADLMLIF